MLSSRSKNSLRPCNSNKFFSNSTRYEEAVMVPPFSLCNCITENNIQLHLPTPYILDFYTNVPDGSCFWDFVIQSNKIFSKLDKIWLWISYDSWLEFESMLRKSYYMRKELNHKLLPLDLAHNADIVLYINLLINEILDKKNMEFLEKVNPLYTYNNKNELLNCNRYKHLNKQIIIIPYTNSIYPSLMNIYEACDYYTYVETYLNPTSYLKCFENAIKSQYVSCFNYDAKLFENITYDDIRGVLENWPDWTITEKVSYLFKGTIFHSCGYTLETFLKQLSEYKLMNLYLQALKSFNILSSIEKNSVILSFIILNAVYTQHGLSFYKMIKSDIINILFKEGEKHPAAEHIIDMDIYIYQLFKTDPYFSNFEQFISGSIDFKKCTVRCYSGWYELPKELLLKINYVYEQHFKKII